eukprot:525668-Prymnesium_polylepis.1
MACEAIAGYTASSDGLAALCAVPGVSSKLLAALARRHTGASAQNAAAALVNLSQLPDERNVLVKEGAVSTILSCVEDGADDTLLTYSSMLLANLTQLAEAQQQLITARGGKAPRAVLKLLCERRGEVTDHFALVLTNIAQDAAGRRALISALSEGAPPAAALGAQLWGGEMRQQGVALLLRNLCFEAEDDAPCQKLLLDASPALIALLAARLSPPGAEYGAAERERLAPLTRDTIAAPPTADAADEQVRLAATEALLLLSASADVCASLREQGVAALLQAAHAQETAPQVRAVNEELVAQCLRVVAEPAAFKGTAADGAADEMAKLRVAEDEVGDGPSEEVDD